MNKGFELQFSNCTLSDTRVKTWYNPSVGVITPVLIPEPLIYCREQCCDLHMHTAVKLNALLMYGHVGV